MGKNIVICCDGTGNDEDDGTHVYRLAEAARQAPREKQVVFYDSGVGTKLSKLLAMGFGAGLSRNVRDAYRFLARHYVPGDAVYVFGFSRGAYTARSLLSLIARYGLLSSDASRLRFNRQVYKIYVAYRWRGRGRRGERTLRRIQRYTLRETPIHGLGVWDTVGSVGVGHLSKDEARRATHRYHDMALPDSVRTACQALALDERRVDYTPCPWTDEELARDGVEEAWFAGAHSDVGGGYKDKRLANVAYRWVLEHMDGVILPDGYLDEIDADPCGRMHDSIGDSSLRAIWEKRPRADRVVPPAARIHESVRTRYVGPLREPHPTLEPDENYVPVPFQGHPDWTAE